MRPWPVAGLVALVALGAAEPAAARDRDFTHPPFAARSSGHVGVSVTFRQAARHVRISLGGRGSRVERVPGTRTAFYAVVRASGRMRAGGMHTATLCWSGPSGRRSVTTRLYVHRRFPGGRG
ncbi:MAG: hypothetical protein QOC68_3851 [Solirubrobacteraceae bacterium]|jgi:hypothetical protein|nr:hypothetical protein [Solirubrobacteraceae bacterium]